MKTSAEWAKALNLEPHVEGGYYRQVVKSSERVREGERALYTSIYFVLEADNPSHFHRLTCDEIWYYHAGQPLTVHMIHPDGRYETVDLGLDPEQGQHLSYVVPQRTIFGSTVEEGYALVSCLCAPGFEYDDFELFSRQDLLDQYPDHAAIIERLTREDEA
ncbi:cupin domain-containing protein [Aerococcus sanguinicola]|uniref:cupin domain-containing protein n=1 Tax=unclassified Aerococcus TaxID=2618060 RepID=UPI0008A37AF5|nr:MULTISPECIES: cupin domain-containing protein [unclassified Aerococcus]KAB0647954.1 cupin domain-containing protein [Aerococcus sanguinicola]MDK6233453.1 cupin domain-containing protein [Aerococcus sp. UMB10185]MDK6855564.1 cupin domain-containing protein [Aerococcus sp. UMB7533]OFN02405.1 cupin [Aerococcus sp. HMSC062A02]OHO43244.1 cupin [Aerococcus sp. HMSC035B07]